MNTNDPFYSPEHAWNAVEVDGHWSFIDATWGAGGLGVKYTRTRKILHKVIHRVRPYKPKPQFIFDYHDEYFLTPAPKFILDHAPQDPQWQVLPAVIPITVFEKDDEDIIKYEKENNLTRAGNESKDFQEPDSKDIEVIKQVCDRAYEYNDRCNVVMATRELAIGDELVTDSLQGRNTILIDRIKLHYNAAIEYLKCNKSGIDEKYRLLQANNNGKKTMLTADNKALKRINTYIEGKAKSNYANGKTLLDNLEQKLDEASYKAAPRIGPLNVQPSTGDNKSAENRDKLFASLHKSGKQIKDLRIATEKAKVKVAYWQKALKEAIDSIREGVENGDSCINTELMLRVSRYDSYKKPVRTVRKQLLRIKQNSDSVYAHLFYGYIDSVKTTERDINNNLRNINIALKDEIGQIRTDPTLVNKDLVRWFNQDVDTITAVTEEINNRLAGQVEFWSSIVPYYKPIYAVYKEQDKAFKLEEKFEKIRFTKMKKHLDLKKKNEVKLNQKNIDLVKDRITELKKIK